MNCNEWSAMRKEKDARHISVYMNYVNPRPGIEEMKNIGGGA